MVCNGVWRHVHMQHPSYAHVRVWNLSAVGPSWRSPLPRLTLLTAHVTLWAKIKLILRVNLLDVDLWGVNHRDLWPAVTTWQWLSREELQSLSSSKLLNKLDLHPINLWFRSSSDKRIRRKDGHEPPDMLTREPDSPLVYLRASHLTLLKSQKQQREQPTRRWRVRGECVTEGSSQCEELLQHNCLV